MVPMMLSLATPNLLAFATVLATVFAQEGLPIVEDRDGGLVLIVLGLVAVAVCALALGGLYFWVTGQTARDRFARQQRVAASSPTAGAPHVGAPQRSEAIAPLFGDAAAQLTLIEGDTPELAGDDGFDIPEDWALQADAPSLLDADGVFAPRAVVTDVPPPAAMAPADALPSDEPAGEAAFWAAPSASDLPSSIDVGFDDGADTIDPVRRERAPAGEEPFDRPPAQRSTLPLDLPARSVAAEPVAGPMTEDLSGLPVPLEGVEMPDGIPRGSDEPDKPTPEIPAW